MIDCDRLTELAEELRAAFRLREEADPDAPRWEAEAHARHIQAKIGELLLNGELDGHTTGAGRTN